MTHSSNFNTPTSAKDGALYWAAVMLGLCYLLPNHYSPWLSVHQEMFAALAIFPLVIWSALRFRNVPGLAIAALALSLVPLTQLLVGKVSWASDASMPFLYLIGFALCLMAGTRLCDVSNDDASSSAAFSAAPLVAPWSGIVFAALVSVGIQVYQWLLLGNGGIYVAELPPGARPFANLAQPNQLATLLLLGAAGVLFFWECGKLRSAPALVAASALVFGLVMTGSRSVLLTLVWLIPAYFLMRRRCELLTTPLAVVFLVGLYLLLAATWGSINEALLLGGDVNTAVDRMATPGIRSVFWSSMADAVSQMPWAGYGWGQIGTAQTITTLDYPPVYSFFDSSHNLLLDLALFSGLPIALAIAGVLVAWFCWQIYNCRDAASFAILAAVCMVFSHALVEYPLYYAYFLLPVGLLMGALCTAHPSRVDLRLRTLPLRIVRPVVLVLSAVALALSVWVVVEYFPMEDDWRLMNFQEARIGNIEVTQPPPALVLTGLRDFLRFSRTVAKPGISPQDLDWMRRVSERYAYASPMFRYALAQALNLDSQGAQLTLRRLCHMQTPGACKSAKQHWVELTQDRWLQLATTPFPDIAADKADVKAKN